MRSRSFLLITRNLPPLRGGMERVNLQICRELATVGAVHVIGPKGCHKYLPTGTSADEVPVKSLAFFFICALFLTVRASIARRPRWVLAGSGLTAPLAAIAAKFSGAGYAVYAHGLDLVAPNFFYQRIWLPCIRLANVCIVNSHNTERLAQVMGVARSRIKIIHPGVAMPAQQRDAAASVAFRARYDLGDGPVLLSVGRLTRRKGLYEFVVKVLPLILKKYPSAKLVVAGDHGQDALAERRDDRWGRIVTAADHLGVSASIRHVGVLSDEELAAAYMSATTHVFPVKEISGDVEGFGMVALEAAAWGTQSVAFAVGGVPDAVADGESGSLVEPLDYQGFANAVCESIEAPLNQETVLAFASALSWERFGLELRATLDMKVKYD